GRRERHLQKLRLLPLDGLEQSGSPASTLESARPWYSSGGRVACRCATLLATHDGFCRCTTKQSARECRPGRAQSAVPTCRSRLMQSGSTQTDVLIIGVGLAGTSLALSLPSSMNVTLLSSAPVPCGASPMALGGLAAVL